MTREFDFEKKILYIDLDGVVADFEKAILNHVPNWKTLSEEDKGKIADDVCGAIPCFFENLEPIDGSIEVIKRLAKSYDVYFLSAPMWNVPASFTGKRIWIEKHFGDDFRKRLILTHRKDLNMGSYLIDDRTRHGVDKFMGKHIHFGTPEFSDWKAVDSYFFNFEIITPKKNNPNFVI